MFVELRALKEFFESRSACPDNIVGGGMCVKDLRIDADAGGLKRFEIPLKQLIDF